MVSEQTTGVVLFVRREHVRAVLATDFLIALRDHVDDLSKKGEALELRRVRDEIIECIQLGEAILQQGAREREAHAEYSRKES